uniref:Uncharacterized protein n=1 Tax=Octopus bimaculoides TaxID=37653 RepID=A0A0L8GIL2_OCTBM
MQLIIQIVFQATRRHGYVSFSCFLFPLHSSDLVFSLIKMRLVFSHKSIRKCLLFETGINITHQKYFT